MRAQYWGDGASVLDRELFAFLEATADAAFAVTEDGLIRFWNTAAETLFGYPAKVALHRTCYELLRGHGALGNQVCCAHCDPWACVAGGQTVPNFDLEVLLASGERRWVNVSNLFMRRRSGALMIHLARDISARKHQEDVAGKLLQQIRTLARESAVLADESERLDPVQVLSAHQCDILRRFAAGRESPEVAHELGITQQSLRNHMHRIHQVLHTHNRTAAVIQAQRRRLI